MVKAWILEDYAAALDQLDSALQTPVTHDLMKAGSIQYFEFCFELAWKAIKIVAEDFGLPAGQSPKGCVKIAFAQGWIDDEVLWLQMLEARNRMSHTYNSASALAIYEQLPGFLPAMNALLDNLNRVAIDPS